MAKIKKPRSQIEEEIYNRSINYRAFDPRYSIEETKKIRQSMAKHKELLNGMPDDMLEREAKYAGVSVYKESKKRKGAKLI